MDDSGVAYWLAITRILEAPEVEAQVRLTLAQEEGKDLKSNVLGVLAACFFTFLVAFVLYFVLSFGLFYTPQVTNDFMLIFW